MKHPDLGNGNCQNCFEVKKKFASDNNITLDELFKSETFCELVCDAHQHNAVKELPSVISVFIETSRHIFKEYLFCDDNLATNEITLQEMLVPYSNNPKPFSSIPGGYKKTPQIVTPEFAKKVRSVFNKSVMTAVDKLMQFLCTSNLKNFTFLIHSNNTFLTILENFLKLKIAPDCVQQGNKINYLEVSCLQIRFLNVGMYLKGSVFDIAEQYNIQYQKYYFPSSSNKLCLLSYKGCKPHLKEYFSYSDTKTDRKDIKEFYDTVLEPWCAQSELINCVRNDCVILLRSCISFLKQTLELQDFISHTVKVPTVDIIHPFGWQIISLSSFTYSIYQYFFLNNYNMFSVMNPYTGGRTNASRGEYEWTEWLNFIGEGTNIKNAFNSFEGQINFGKHYVDGYSAEDKIVYQYQGCEFHYHDPAVCLNPVNKKRTLESVNCVNKTLGVMKQEQEEVNLNSVTRGFVRIFWLVAPLK